MLLSLLGDYWWERRELLPSAALVDLLAEFGVSDVAARAALSRLVKKGLLATTKVGRHTFYGMTEKTLQLLNEGAERTFGFGRDAVAWNGQWSMVAFSIPESSRAIRGALRAQLRWLGFAPLYDGLWVSPHDRNDAALAELVSLGVSTATAFRAIVQTAGNHHQPQMAWDLKELAEHYWEFIGSAELLQEELESGALTPATALVSRARLMDAWRAFLVLDPDLPAELLPDEWPRARARALFLATYMAMGELGTARIREVIAVHSPQAAALATYHRSTYAT